MKTWHKRFYLLVLAAVFAVGAAGPAVRAQSSDIKSVEPKDIKDIVAQNKGKVDRSKVEGMARNRTLS